MPPLERKYDALGFPIPTKFEDLDPRAESNEPKARRKPGIARRRMALLVLVAFLVILFGKPVRQVVGEVLSDWCTLQAYNHLQQGELDSAVSSLSWALFWKPDDARALAARAEIKLEANDLAGSLADFNRVLVKDKKNAAAFMQRGLVLERMGRHDQALADCDKAVELRPNEAVTLNHRAYLRALAGRDLEGAQKDIARALDLVGVGPDVQNAPRESASYLDTRGYLYYLQGKMEPARADLDRAVQLMDEDLGFAEMQLHGRHGRRIGMARYVLKQKKEGLAVIYHHRGLVLQRLGELEAAEADIRRGDELGYNPAEGVY